MFQRSARNKDAVTLMAADVVTANLMVADENLNILYMNSAVISLLKEAEADIRTDLPRFSVASLIGSNIDVFHKNPSYQRKMLEGLSATHRATIRVGGRTFDLVATPLRGKDGKRAGTVVEWADATLRLQNLAFASQADAISRAQAVIEFNMDGTIITANENFLKTLGYLLGEIQGKHHSMFVEPSFRDSAAYREFWATLNQGQYQAAEYKRIGKGGKEVWILASYNPVFDEKGKPFKVVKFATDVTEQKLKTADLAGQIAAIGKSQAVIEFKMDGTISGANENFRGVYQAGEFKRSGRGGKEVWIQASYNPILDLNGKPFKVVKYAADTTKQVLNRMANEKVRGMMESVAAGAEELNASVREISEAMVKSKETAMSTVGQVETADSQAQRLSEAAKSMGSIVELINNIVIRQSIQNVSEYVTSTAAAIEEQSTVTSEMSSSMQRAAAEAAAIAG